MRIQLVKGKILLIGLIILILFVGYGKVNAQSRSFMEHGRMVHQYGFEDGLKIDEIPSILQTKDGYIWLVSMGQLIRYDGYAFKHYYLPKKLKSYNTSDYIWKLQEDKENNIWITTYNSTIWKFFPQEERFERLDLTKNENITSHQKYTLIEGRKEDLLVGGLDGLFHVRKNDYAQLAYYSFENLKDIFGTKEDSLTFPNTGFRRVIPFKDLQGDIWGGASHGVLFSIDYQRDSVQLNYLADDSGERNWQAWDDLEWITDYDNNHLLLCGFKKIEEKFEHFIGIINKKTGVFTKIKSGLPIDFRTRKVLLDRDKNIWISTENGLFELKQPILFKGDERTPNLIKYNLYEKDKTNPLEVVRGITEDSYGNIWVGSRFKFMFRIDYEKESLKFINFLDYPDYQANHEIGLPYEDSNHNVWISSRNKGIVKYNTIADSLNFFDSGLGNIPASGLSCIYEFVNGDLLFGGLDEKLIRYNLETKKAKVITLDYIGENDQLVFSIDFNENQIILVGRNNFYLVNKADLSLIHHFSNVWAVMKGSKNSLWSNNFRNLIKYEVNVGKVDSVFSMPNNQLFSVAEDEKTGYWFGGAFGLIHLANGDTSLTYFDENDGLINNTIIEIIRDKEFLWIFTVKGISRFNLTDFTFDNFNELAHIGKIRNLGLIIQNSDRHFRIIGDNGLYTFHPDSLSNDTTPPKIIIQDMIIEEKGLNRHQKNDIFQLGFLQLNYFQNDISFNYVGINFKNTAKNQYQYQLEGFQKDWQHVGIDRTARFSNLPPGNYTFKVKAANADGIWSKPKSLKITILPPWWQTWWAYILYAVAAIGSLWWYIQSLNKKLAKEQAHNQELTDLNQANQRFVPQDILNILGKKSIKDLQLGDQIRTQMTVLFSDIRDYTPLSESMTPEENFKFINSYLGRVGPIIKEHGGFISSYLGDGLMALFVNEPAKAVQATIAIQKELENYNQVRIGQNRNALRTGMGLNTGELMLGVIGDEYRYESTVISDAVNTASRMEGLTKVFGAAIILSEKTLIGLNVGDTFKVSPTFKPDFAYRYLGKVKVKGKDKAIKIYDLYEGEPIAIRQLKAKTHLLFEQGITHYYKKEFGKAAECFKQVLTVNETDKAAQYYLDKSVRYIVNGVAEDWSGVEEMVMK